MLINGLIIIKTLICKIPPNLPLLKGVPRFAGFGKEERACLPVGRGRFSNDYVNSILGPFIIAEKIVIPGPGMISIRVLKCSSDKGSSTHCQSFGTPEDGLLSQNRPLHSI